MAKYGVCSRCGKDYSKEGNHIGTGYKNIVGFQWVLKFTDEHLKQYPILPAIQTSEIIFLCDDCMRALHAFMKGDGVNESDQQGGSDDSHSNDIRH